MSTSGAALTLHHRLDPEDAARAAFYALIACLFAEAPDGPLLRAIAAADPMTAEPAADASAASGSLSRSWDVLRAASAAMDADAAAEEYNNIFIGLGKSEVNLHASHWLTGFMMEKPLAELRASLAILGLGRQPGTTMLEDHLSALCETMRILIAGQDERRPATLADQRAFFERQLAPWVYDCCAAIEKNSIANYYRRVAQFSALFMALERDSLAIE